MEILDIKLDEITDPTFQPRDKLEVEGIEALSNSIKEIGLINPVVVRKSEEGYQLVAGTRTCPNPMTAWPRAPREAWPRAGPV